MEQYRPSRANDNIYEGVSERVEPFKVMAAAINTAYKVHINEDFKDVRQFEDIVQVLDSARQGDVVEMLLSTSGGALHAILPILAAMERTQALTVVHAVSDVASAGTFFLMKADEVYINPYVTIMFHQVQFGSAGAGSSVEAHVAHTLKASKAIIHDMYKDFFTEKEIEAMLSGKDFYMDKEEFDTRYEKRREIREKEMESDDEENPFLDISPETTSILEKIEKPVKKRSKKTQADA